VVTAGRWKRHHVIDHIRLTVSRVIWHWISSWVRGNSRSFNLVPFKSSVAVY